MKKLIVSMKTSNAMFRDFKRTANRIKSGKAPQSPHYEISFESKKDFDRFVRNISVLMTILKSKPKSVYELAKLIGSDVSNARKIIDFFETVGAIRIKEQKVSGRTLRTPIVDYQKIEFNLEAA